MIIEIFEGSLEELKADILLIPHIQGASKDLYIKSSLETKGPKKLVFFVGGSGNNLKDLPDALDKAFLRLEDFIFSAMAPVNTVGTIAPSLNDN
jgi:hypothetical protein